MDGLTVGYAQGDVEKTTNTKSDESTMFAKYATGPITVGIQTSEKDNETVVLQMTSQQELVFLTK